MSYSQGSSAPLDRFDTPDPDLDDHRFQPESLPPAIESHPHARRGTLASIADNERTPRPVLNMPAVAIDQHGVITRDFENAIADDAQSLRRGSIQSRGSKRSIKSNYSSRSRRTADEAWHRDRRISNAPVANKTDMLSPHSPIAAKHDTFRRAIRNRQKAAGSRDSSRSRSSSPPNSVDAFARPRAGTMNSFNGSIAHPTIIRPPSAAGTHRGRSGTLEQDGTVGHRTEVASRRSSVQDDVCFPPEELTNSYTIDFEDLEEFVSQTHPKTPVAHPFMPLFTRHNEQQRRIFTDQRENGSGYFDEKAFGFAEPGTASSAIDEKIGAEPVEELTRVISASETQNRFTFFSSEMDETVHAPELGGLLMPGESFRDLFELNPEGGVWWLDMLNPSEEEIFAICGAFRVHPLTREDITTQETREKVELFKSYYFVCFTSFYAVDKTSEHYLEPINIYAVVFREGLLTFSFCPNPHVANVRKRISRLRDYLNISADWICYALIDEIVDSFGPVLREVERETDTIEDSVYTARFEDSRAMLQQISECRKRVMSLGRLLGGKADVIKGFAKKCNEAYAIAPRGDVGLYLSDVQDHIVTMMSNLGHFEKMLGRSHSNHLAQITLRHTEQGSRANNLLGKITIFATILVPLNLVAGLFGMNVPVPGGVNPGGLEWWFGIIGVMIGFSLLCILTAKKFKLI